MELEDGIHKSRPKGSWFESEPEPEPTLAPQRGKRARWWPVLIVVLVVVILSGGVLVSTRFGRSTSTRKQAIHSTWCVSSGAPLDAQAGTSSLSTITAFASNNAWVLGSVSQSDSNANSVQTLPLAEHWNGARWSVIPTADTSNLLTNLTNKVQGSANETTMLHSMAAISADDIWAVGSVGVWQNSPNIVIGHTLIERWDGSQWRVVPSPDGFAQGENVLSSVVALSADDVWAVGDTTPLSDEAVFGSSSPLVEHWDGSHWRTVQLPALLQTGALYDVAAISSDDIWAVGADTTPGSLSGEAPLVLHWNGQNWSIAALPRSLGLGGFNSVTVISANDVWAVGQGPFRMNGEETMPPLIAHWDGHHWSSVEGAKGAPNESVLRAIAANGANDIWAVGTSGNSLAGRTPFLEHWDGQQWSSVPVQTLHTGSLTSMAMAGGKIWTVGVSIDSTGRLTGSLIAVTC